MFAWQFGKMLSISKANGWARFVTMQNYVNLLYREEEREMLPLCQAEGIGVIPWSPLARGRLTRPFDEKTARSETDEFGKTLYLERTADGDRKIVDAVAAIAQERGVPAAQIALAWVSSKPAISAPIIGASKTNHIEDAIESLKIALSFEEIRRLEEHYITRSIAGFS
jgi:aryl-alcohol dehydrogenase-like predicted oxidoreductase